MRKVVWLLVLAIIPLFPAPSGAISVSINGTALSSTGRLFTDAAGRPAFDISGTFGVFTISGSSSTVRPEVAVVEGSTVDQLILTNALIRAGGTAGSFSTINITYSHAFALFLTSQILPAGVSTSGSFARGLSLASGDNITVQGLVGFVDPHEFCGEGSCSLEEFLTIGGNVAYTVPSSGALTANNFAPTNPAQSTGSFLCDNLVTADDTGGPCNTSESDILKTTASITLRSGDSIRLASGGIITVGCRTGDADCPGAFQAQPEPAPEPSTLLLVVSAITGLGLLGRTYGGGKPARPSGTTRPAE